MCSQVKIKRALVSVFHKDGLDTIINLLAAQGVEFVSTGGTADFIESLGHPCVRVETITGYPSVFGGRVKTLHPAIFGGILNRRADEGDREQKGRYGIEDIDLVIVDLYPFEQTVASGAPEQDIIEKIDIGGISLIRAAAKNFEDVVIVASKAQYRPLQEILEKQGAVTDLEQRRAFAASAFAVSSSYDSAIYNWFAAPVPENLHVAVDGSMSLRYGENPHQSARFYGRFEDLFEKLHGKEVSYNNLLDIDAAVKLIAEFEEPTFAVLKHNNACGIATRPSIREAWDAALACDPVSAFGGVLVANRLVDRETAELVNKIFFEVIIAPDYSEEALETLKSKKNRIILVQRKALVQPDTLRSVLNGVLKQEPDTALQNEEVTVYGEPTPGQLADLQFANKVVKHSKSNAIVLAKDGQLMASGVGQTSRVDALKQAIDKARAFGFGLKGAVMASDAFFPFSDCVELAHQAGVEAVIHPGGSIRDQESIDFCRDHGMAMVVTGMRHFKH